MQSITAVIFDMDGVLIDSIPYNIRAFDEVLAPYGLRIDMVTDPHGQHFRGTSFRNMLDAVESQHGIKIDIHDFTAKMDNLTFIAIEEDMISADPSLIRLLDTLRAHRIKVGLGTASPLRRTEKILQILGIRDYFDVLVTAEDVTHHKPHPHVYLEASRRLNTSSCVVVEDALAGIEAGHSAGMHVIGFTQFTDKSALIGATNYIADNYMELESLLFNFLPPIQKHVKTIAISDDMGYKQLT